MFETVKMIFWVLFSILLFSVATSILCILKFFALFQTTNMKMLSSYVIYQMRSFLRQSLDFDFQFETENLINFSSVLSWEDVIKCKIWVVCINVLSSYRGAVQNCKLYQHERGWSFWMTEEAPLYFESIDRLIDHHRRETLSMWTKELPIKLTQPVGLFDDVTPLIWPHTSSIILLLHSAHSPSPFSILHMLG